MIQSRQPLCTRHSSDIVHTIIYSWYTNYYRYTRHPFSSRFTGNSGAFLNWYFFATTYIVMCISSSCLQSHYTVLQLYRKRIINSLFQTMVWFYSTYFSHGLLSRLVPEGCASIRRGFMRTVRLFLEYFIPFSYK